MVASLFLANPAGLWLLLALPLVVLIHFFQQPSRRLDISTFFLLESVPPESLRGRTFEKFRQSLPLWLQLLAVLVLVWLLIDPRWLHPLREQRVLLLLDSSASMSAFPEEREKALQELVIKWSSQAVETHWTLMETYPGAAKLYEGNNAQAMLRSLQDWKPGRPRHDFGPVLDLASTWQTEGSTAILITDGQEELHSPINHQLVGRYVDNVGIVGSEVRSVDGRMQWSAVVRNFSRLKQEREWWTEVERGKPETKKLQLEPGQSRIVSGTFTEGHPRLWIMLEPDAFSLDDRLPVLNPQERIVSVSLQTLGKGEGFFRKLIERTAVARLEADASRADILIASSLTGYLPALGRKDQASIILRQRRETADRLEPSPVVAERHPLVEHLRWQGLLSSGPEEFSLQARDQVLVWQKGRPLIFLRTEQAPSLMLNFDFEYSNADRLPAVLVMINRFLEEASRSLPGYRALNVLPGQSVRWISDANDPAVEKSVSTGTGTEETKHKLPSGTSKMKVPDEPCFFHLRQGQTEIMDGAVQFLDPFEGDFSKTGPGNTWQEGMKERQETRSQPDPLRPVWILLLGALFIWLWWLQPGRLHAI